MAIRSSYTDATREDRGPETSRSEARSLARRAAALALSGVLLTGCAWRRVEPRPDAAAPARLAGAVGLSAADASTSLSDLQAIARAWSEARAFDRVQFPYREGDPVDLVVEVKLRQRAVLHRGANTGKAIVVGLSLGLLSPVLGPRITEVHDVAVRCLAGGTRVGPRAFEVATDTVFGFGADAQAVARDLDDAQRRRIASAVLGFVAEACAVPSRGPADEPR